MGVEEGLALLWSVMVCKWAMRMMLGVFSVNETKGQEEAPWEVKEILRVFFTTLPASRPMRFHCVFK